MLFSLDGLPPDEEERVGVPILEGVQQQIGTASPATENDEWRYCSRYVHAVFPTSNYLSLLETYQIWTAHTDRHKPHTHQHDYQGNNRETKPASFTGIVSLEHLAQHTRVSAVGV